MNLFPDSTTVFSIGSISVKWYAVFILTGAFMTYLVIEQNFKKKNIPKVILDDLFFGCLLSGVLGARLWYILFDNLQYYLANPGQILNFQNGGLAIHGGLILGVLYALIYVKRKGYSFFILADEIIYTILLAQAIGRWGNFINKEAFGPVVNESFFNFFPEFIKSGMLVNGQYHMPMFLFESLANLVGFLIIHFLIHSRKNNKPGDVAFAYLIWYGLVRFFIEIFRTDALLVGNSGLKIAQIISILFIVIGILGTFGLFRKLFYTKPVLLFDFDGTLMDSKPTIQASFKQLFSEVETKHPLTEEDYDWVIGPSVFDSIEKYVVNPDTQALFERFREIKKQYLDLTFPIPNAVETITDLHRQGYRIGIVSNKYSQAIIDELVKFNMHQAVDFVYGYDLAQKPKPDPDACYQPLMRLKGKKDNFIVIGDSVDDIKMGNEAGGYTIGYVANDLRKEQMMAAQPNLLISDLRELLEIVKKEKIWKHSTM